MTSQPAAVASADQPWLTPGVVTVILTSAFLLFSVQPMFAKMVLPWLGGSPGVWSVAMVFFQGLLLAGYLYAHLSTRYLPHRAAVLLHAGLTALAFLMLPLGVSQAFGEPPESQQAFWLLAVFGASVGLPFFVLSATAPLVQAWFARSGHSRADNPYVLYAASNIGSFAALIAYPVLIEPLMPLRSQTASWTWLFVALAVGLALCGLAIKPVGNARSVQQPDASSITFRNKAAWTGLAAIPSGLLVAVTAHLSTDVASAPLLWVAPLAIFLLTFVIVFRDRPWLPDPLIVKGWTWVAPIVILLSVGFLLPLPLQFAVHLGGLLLASLLCHRRLYLLRPAPARLTEFYLWMSFGGMLGGLFTGLIAPVVFERILEYRILLAASLLALPAAATAPAFRRQLHIVAGLILVAALFLLAVSPLYAVIGSAIEQVAMTVVALLLGVIIFNRWGPVASAGAAVAAYMVLSPMTGGREEVVERSFFGVNYMRTSPEGDMRVLQHGTTVHGAVRIRNADGTPVSGRPEATTYYADSAALNLALRAARERAGGRLGQVGVLGLGAGAMACQSVPGEAWTYFEIDRKVADLALKRELFPFLSECTPDARIVIGDARLTLQKETVLFDVILLDAFSSDAVPAHLLTREAMAIYAERLAPGGMIIAHVSNRYLDVRTVAEAAALANGLVARSTFTPVAADDERAKRQMQTPTTAVVIARKLDDLGSLARNPAWTAPLPDALDALWTDDYANIVGALIREWRQPARRR